jgi:DNA-binding FadR family transcriptional regulator
VGADRGTRRLSIACWFDIQHGKPTRVRDHWREGNLNVLSALVRHSVPLPDDFIPNLLAVRMCLAPAYARAGVDQSTDQVIDLLKACTDKGRSGELCGSRLESAQRFYPGFRLSRFHGD